jgi:hypothetical protein
VLVHATWEALAKSLLRPGELDDAYAAPHLLDSNA